MARILVIDDDVGFCRSLQAVIGSMGYESDAAHSLEAGLAALHRKDFDVVVLDVVLPDGNGLESIPAIRQEPDAPEIIILTGQGDPDGAELAIKSRAWDYITKPGTLSKIRLPIGRAVDYHRSQALAAPNWRQLMGRDAPRGISCLNANSFRPVCRGFRRSEVLGLQEI